MRKHASAIAVLLLMAAVAPASLAQSNELPDPGITPDSPFAFLDRWGEALGLFFARGAEARAAKQLRYAEERLAEAEVMAEEGKSEEAEEAVDRYGSLISAAAANLATAAREGEDTSAALADLVTKATSIHQTVLAEVYEQVSGAGETRHPTGDDAERPGAGGRAQCALRQSAAGRARSAAGAGRRQRADRGTPRPRRADSDTPV